MIPKKVLRRNLLTGDRNPQVFRNGFYDPPSSDVLTAVDLRFRYSSQQTFAIQNFNPKFAHFWDIRYRQTLGNNTVKGDVFSARLDLFFPGAFT